MAISTTSLAQLQNIRRTEDRLTLQQERFRVRAVELRRRQLILQNELASPGINETERSYIQQRMQTLSAEEDALGTQVARTEQELKVVRDQILQLEQEQRQAGQRRQTLLGTRGQRQIAQAIQTGDSVRLEKAERLYRRRQQERSQTYASLASQAKKAFILIGVLALAIAAVADILSFFDVGWLISWLLPLVTWFIVRRINRINRSVQNIATAQQQLLREIAVARQRLRPALAAEGRTDLLTSNPVLIQATISSYVFTFMRDQVVSQTLEFIPIFDWLPMYLGDVVKILIDQRRAYRKAQEALMPYRQTLDLLDRLERFELQAAAAQAGAPLNLLPAYQF